MDGGGALDRGPSPLHWELMKEKTWSDVADRTLVLVRSTCSWLEPSSDSGEKYWNQGRLSDGSRPPFTRANSDYQPSLFSHCTTRALHSRRAVLSDHMPNILRNGFYTVSRSISLFSRLSSSFIHSHCLSLNCVISTTAPPPFLAH